MFYYVFNPLKQVEVHMKDILLTDEVIEELDEIVKLHKQKGPDDKELED
jgi:hypothetical protein